jgi:hypothetical protein
MISPNGDGCVPKLEHCNTTYTDDNEEVRSFHNQPQTLTPNHDFNQWKCEECELGFFFKMDFPEGYQW